MSSVTTAFSAWISKLPKWHGWLQLSPERPYAHDEEGYDQQYGVVAPEPQDGQGLCVLLAAHQIDTTGPALEIGCGTGRLSYGLAQHYPGSDLLITDPSPAFLRLTQNHLSTIPPSSARPHFAVLNADDLGQLPAGLFSLITMRSTLHHILHVDHFIANCARVLRPGGAVCLGAEPCESGYLLMATVAQGILPTLHAAGIPVKPEWEKQIQTFTDTVKFYCRRDLNKVRAEDKHLFRVHELADLGHAHGLHLQFFPNAAFADYAPGALPDFEGFSPFFLNYLQYCMLFDPAFIDLIREHLQPQLQYIEDCYPNHVGPAITGVFLFRKIGPAA